MGRENLAISIVKNFHIVFMTKTITRFPYFNDILKEQDKNFYFSLWQLLSLNRKPMCDVI